MGIGYGASEYTIKNVAKVGGGTSEFVLDNEDIGDKAVYMIESAVSQHLQNINLNVECYDEQKNLLKAFSKKVDVLLKDQPFKQWVLLQDLKGVNYCTADIEYYNSLLNSYVKKQLTIDGFKTPEVTDFWHKIAYDAKMKELDQQIKFGHREINKNDLKSQIVDLSIKYQVLSDYTSFFAVLAENTMKEGEKASRLLIPNVDSSDYLKESISVGGYGSANIGYLKDSSLQPEYGEKVVVEHDRFYPSLARAARSANSRHNIPDTSIFGGIGDILTNVIQDYEEEGGEKSSRSTTHYFTSIALCIALVFLSMWYFKKKVQFNPYKFHNKITFILNKNY